MVKEIKPIPLELLGDKATYLSIKKDRWGDEVTAETELSDVLVQSQNKIERRYTQQINNESDSNKLLLFFDAVNSKPNGFNFYVDDKVKYEGKEYRVAEVEKVKAFRSVVHHLEVVLE